MKMGFVFSIFLLGTVQNAQSMNEAPSPLKMETQSANQEPDASPDPTSMLIKACKRSDTTDSLVAYLLSKDADVNKPIEGTTALLTTIDNPITEENPFLLHMLVVQATPESKILALKHAIQTKKWKTAVLLQDHYHVVLCDDDIQENHTFVFEPGIAWIKRKAIAAKIGLVNAIENLKRRAHHDDNDNDDVDAIYTMHESSQPLDDAQMNIASLGGMPS